MSEMTYGPTEREIKESLRHCSKILHYAAEHFSRRFDPIFTNDLLDVSTAVLFIVRGIRDEEQALDTQIKDATNDEFEDGEVLVDMDTGEDVTFFSVPKSRYKWVKLEGYSVPFWYHEHEFHRRFRSKRHADKNEGDPDQEVRQD